MSGCDIDFEDALFVLGCGHIIVGCSGSAPARCWLSGVRNGMLWCATHQAWVTLVNVTSPALVAEGETP